ncbi:MAG: T9SS type A sorting domain-containing protein, partial [Candidatus Marinimicrobia bacterium]|nr:T9SS type A sorting domain-containing protein [Candidatus Neomarinimicrobiota bacterium]
LYGTGQSTAFIENVIDEGYRTRYEVLMDSFHDTFTSWNDKAIFYYERGNEDTDNITRILHSDLDDAGQSVTQKVTGTETESTFLSSVIANSFIPAETVQGNIEQSTTAIVRLWTRKPRVLLVPETANPESSDALTARILHALDEIRIHPELRRYWYHGETLADQSIRELDTAYFIEISQPDKSEARLLLALSKTDEHNSVEVTLSDGTVVQLQATPGGSYYILNHSGTPEAVAAYDGNGDSIPDREQISVASLPTPSRVGTITLESMANGEFVNTQFVASDASLRKHNLESTAQSVVYDQGLEGAEFLVTTLRQPQVREANINLYIPEEYLNMNFYLGFGQNDFSEHSLQKLSDSRGHIALNVIDGGRGDADGMQNGEIALLGIFAPPPGSPDVEAPSADPVVCYPNPFNPSRNNVRIQFNELGGEKNIRIYDLGGRLVTTLRSSSAETEVQWDGFNGAGQQVASGTYFVVVENPEMQRIVEKISLIR